MSLMPRIKGILLQPQQEWATINAETTSVAELYKGYIMPLALIGPVASIIGLTFVGISLPILGNYTVPISTSVSQAAVSYVLTLAGVYILALIIDALAPTFSGEKNQLQAMKVSAYAGTAAWVVGIFSIIPALSILGMLGLYSLYLLYLGLPVLMKVPQEKSLGYTIPVIVAAVVIFLIIGVVSSTFVSYPGLR
jgi:hypothetical protein